MSSAPNKVAKEFRTQGTYVPSKFVAKEREFDRLCRQASVLPSLEKKLLAETGLSPGMQVLDAACGPGIVSGLLCEQVCLPSGRGRVIGVDQDQEMLAVARERALGQGQEILFLHENIYALPFKEKFDYIYCRFLFQHLNDPAQALRSLLSALKPGGILHILDVCDDWLFVEPPFPAFDRLCHLANQCQAADGGDRKIGRKLRNLMLENGLGDVQTDAIMVNSDMIGMDIFLQLTTEFKLELIQAKHPREKTEIAEALRHLKEDHFAATGLFSVSGRKRRA
jgi:SAM-dependent methyltransferase